MKKLTRRLIERPRLFYSYGDIKGINAADKEIQALVKKADELLEQDLLSEEYANSVYNQHGRFYEIGEQLAKFAHTFGFLFSIGIKTYAEKMKEALLHYASFNAWTGPSNKDRETPWKSDLSTTRIVYAYAFALDTMCDYFSAAERKTVIYALINLGIKPLLDDWVNPGARIHALDSMGHNWWSVCVSLAGIGICSCYEDYPDADRDLYSVTRALKGFCEYEGSVLFNKPANFDDGMFYESAGYFDYGVGELLRFKYVFERVFENKRTDYGVLKKTGDAFLQMTYPVSDKKTGFKTVNFGDSSTADFKKYDMVAKFLILLGTATENVKVFYKRYHAEEDFLNIIYKDKFITEADRITLPKAGLFKNSGLFFLRNSWENDECFLAVRCGHTWNHAHDDAGSFVIYDKGKPLFIDSGCCVYSRPLLDSYYRAAAAHNVVLINGRAQSKETIYRGSKFTGKLTDFVTDGTFAYVLADATGPTSGQCMRNYRSIIRIGEKVFVIIDDLYAYEASDFDFLLHFNGRAQKTADNVITIDDVCKSNIYPVFPKDASITERIGYAEPHKGGFNNDDRTPEQETKYIAVSAKGKSRVMQFINVISIERDIKIKPIEGANQTGVEIEDNGVSTYIYYNILADGRNMHINSNNNLGGYDTDAYILAVRGKKALVVQGSYLRKNRSLFDNYTKQTKIITIK